MTSVSVICVTFNGRDVVARLLESFERTAPGVRLLVGDNGSTDGVQDLLDAAPFVDWASVPAALADDERRPAGASAVSHALALDAMVAQLDTECVVTVDSDIEFLEQGWLPELVAPLERDGYVAVGEYEPRLGGSQPRLAVHLMALSLDWFRSQRRSFRGAASFPNDDEEARRWRARTPSLRVTEQELAEFPNAQIYSTGALLFQDMIAEDAPFAVTPPRVRAKYRHVEHASWPVTAC